GRYRLELEQPGFKRFVQEPIEVRVQQFVSLNPVLEVGQATQTVEVTGQVALLDSATSSLSQVVENRQVTELPLNGRNTLALAALTPGIRTHGQFLQNTATRSFAGWGNFSSNGGVADANEVLVDGAAVTMFLINQPSLIPPVDATQEFRVQTNNYSAEFGRSAGAVVNVSIKSGTNQLHGSLYEFLRNDQLDANDFFQNRAGQARPKLAYNQYGFATGGPVWLPHVYDGRDRTFFFVNFEGFRQRQAMALTTTVPTAAQLQGDFSQTFNASGQPVIIANPFSVHNGLRDPFPNNQIPQSMFDAVSNKLRVNGRVWALPNGPGAAFTGVGNFSTSAVQPIDEDQVVTRMDHAIGSKWKVFGTYAAQSFALGGFDPFRNGTDFLTVGGNESNLTQTAVLGATALFSPSLVGEFRSSFSRFRNNRIPKSDGFDLTTIGFPSAVTSLQQFHAFPRLTFSGVASLGKLSTSEIRRIANNWNQSASLTWIRGGHAFKFGGQFRLQQLNDVQVDDSSGSYTFNQQFTAMDPFKSSSTSGNTVASFLLGIPSSGSMGLGEHLALERRYFGWFFQDDWKLTRKLTLNLGLRYDLELGPTERYNRQSYFDFAAVAPIAQAAGVNVPGALHLTDDKTRAPEQTYWREWGPRFGFAYQLLPKTVLRGGYGIFWLPGGLETSGTSTNNPTATISTPFVSSLDNGVTPHDRWSNPFPNGLIPLLGNSQGLNTLVGQGLGVFLRGGHQGYTQQWNFDVQQQLASGLAVDVAYAGSHGVGLPGSIQIDQLPDQFLQLGTALNQQVANPFFGLVSVGTLSQPTVSRGQLLRPYPQFTGVSLGSTNVGSSIYHSMQMKVTKRFSDSLVAVSYTVSKGIGDSEAVVGWLEQSGTPSGFMDNYNRRLDRSLNAFDSPQRLVVSYTAALPVGKGKRWLGNPGKIGALISGWEVNGIYTAESGTPLFLGTSSNLTNSFGGGSRPNNNGHSAQVSGDAHDRLNRWFDTSVFNQPPAFTFGNTSRTLPDVRDHGTNNLDLGLIKNNRFWKDGRVNLQFRSEFFNIFNRVRFGDPGLTSGTPQFGVVTSQENSPRLIQFALKLLY
ncbi:MAG TPA: carboxypeptidase regulatory-like domain-containing protein, partial [Bryobacterales bacterium]|nr:carboxypeptidase regulatory-like domain-containing protein [Bryobacterales bacterium]